MLIMEQGDESVVNVLPNINKMRIPAEKFTQYALNYDREFNKAIAFELALGYNENNYQLLIDTIHENVSQYEATPKGDIGYGMKYEVIMQITGPNGKTAKVLTAWIDDTNAGELRLTNAYVDK